MKKLLLPLLAILLFTSCQKQVSSDKVSEEFASATASKNADKIMICHHDALTGKNKTMLINPTAWPQHQAHGDLLGDCSEVIVTICGKDWMKKNMNVSTYRDGTSINGTIDYTNSATWSTATTGAWCYQNNDPALGAIYGKFYNWYAVNDVKGLAPLGWHVPTDEEWTALSTCLGGEIVAGGKMKSTGTIDAGTGLWNAPNAGATNSSGFTGLPSGNRDNLGNFGNIGLRVPFWSSSENNSLPNFSWYRMLNYDDPTISRSWNFKSMGFPIRCVRN